MKPVAEAAEAFERETGIAIHFQYGGSATLLNSLNGRPQTYSSLPTPTPSKSARKKGSYVKTSSQNRPQSSQSLKKPARHPFPKIISRRCPTRPSQPERKYRKASKTGLGTRWDEAQAKAVTLLPTVTELATAITVGSADATILWDSTARQFDQATIIEVPEQHTPVKPASASPIKLRPPPTHSDSPAFSQLSRGGDTFQRFDLPDPRRSLGREAGAHHLLRWRQPPPIESLLNQFRDREGIDMVTVFNGGILCSAEAMQETENPRLPDAYYACDVCFVLP